jgi:hypothetical protein
LVAVKVKAVVTVKVEGMDKVGRVVVAVNE